MNKLTPKNATDNVSDPGIIYCWDPMGSINLSLIQGNSSIKSNIHQTQIKQITCEDIADE